MNGKRAGEEWQCVELINRLYLSKGWITGSWFGDGGQSLYDHAPSNLSKEANGSVSYLGPGDVITLAEYNNGTYIGGHAAIVDNAGQQSSGTVSVVSQNSGSSSNATPQRTASISGGNVVYAGGSSGSYSYRVVGVIHAPQTSGGGGVREGGFVRISDGPNTGLIARVVGGTLIGLDTCGPLGGCPNPFAMTQAQFDAYQAAHPNVADGTYVRIASGPLDGLIARAAGGHLFGLDSCEPLGGCPNPVNLTPVAYTGYDNAHPNVADGTYVRIASGPLDGLIARAAGGHLFGLDSCEPLGGCPNPVNLTPVAYTGYDNAHPNVADGTYVRIASGPLDGLIARAAGGHLFGLDSCEPLGGCPNPVNLTPVAYTGYDNAHPNVADGTYVRIASGPLDGLIARAAGGHLFGLDSCEPLGGCPNPVNLTPVAYTGYDNAHPNVADGTYIRFLPSGRTVTVQGGACSAVDAPAMAVSVTDLSYELICAARTATSLSSSVPIALAGQKVVFSARVSSADKSMPTGTVVFTVDGTPSAPVTVNKGKATLTLTSLHAGDHQITASYNGDTSHRASTSTLTTQTVDQANTITKVTTTGTGKSLKATATATATVVPVSPGAGVPSGSITFVVDGTTTTAPLSRGKATVKLGAGTHTVTATYPGTTDYATSTGSL